MKAREVSDEIPERTHLKAPAPRRSILLALCALALASPAYMYAALSRPAVVVTLNDALESGQRVVVKVGEAVRWRNESSDIRTLEVYEGGELRSAVLEPGQTFEYRFRHAGTYRFDAGDIVRHLVRDGVVTVEP